MIRELFYILCCLGLGGMWGYKIYEGAKKKSKFEIIYCATVTGIFAVMAILKIVENFIG